MSRKYFFFRLVLATIMLIALFLQTPVMAFPLSENQQVTVFHSSSEKSFFAGKDLFKFKHLTSDSGRDVETLALVEITLAPNYDGFLLKKHVIDVDESVYATNGDVQCFTGQSSQAIELKAGDMVRIPANVPYGCKSLGNQPNVLLIVSSSSALENLITEIGTPADGQAQTAAEPDMEDVSAVAQKYGINFLN